MPKELLHPTCDHRLHPREAIAVGAERTEVSVQPRLYGYLFEPLLQTADLIDVPMHFAAFAGQQGYDLTWIALERRATMPAAFLALIDEVDKLPTGSAAVAVPSFSHLALPGWERRDLAEQLLLMTGRPVIAVGYPPSAGRNPSQT